jgi:hypothetical protein
LSEDLDAGFAKLVAGIYDVPDADLPVLRQEERRRRRRLVGGIAATALIVLAVVGILANGWWVETKARQLVDFERRLTLAHSLVDIGAVPSAVDVLARMVGDGGGDRLPEARRLLSAWAARLATAKDQLGAIPESTVFRWRGRNYLKRDGGIGASYDGPPALQSAVAGGGRWLITFDADRVIRIRATQAPDVPLLETRQLDATTGTLAEVFDGRLIQFDAKGLALDSDEDKPDAQMEFGRVIVLLDPQARRYAVAVMNDNDDRAVQNGCDAIRVVGAEVSLAEAGQPSQSATPNGTLAVSRSPDGQIRWQNIAAVEPGAAAPTGSAAVTPCPARLLSGSADRARSAGRVELRFPALIDESQLWSATPIARPATPAAPICAMDAEAGAAQTDCYDARRATSKDPEQAGTLTTILRDPSFDPVLIRVGSVDRIEARSAIGKQAVGLALCDIADKMTLRTCLVAEVTAQSRTKLLAGQQFLMLNGPEIQARTFQLIDLAALRFVKVVPAPVEKLADVAMSADGKRMAAVTTAGELWLYDVDREGNIATSTARFDFRSLAAPQRQPPEQPATATAQPANTNQAFDSVAFVQNDRVALSGARGGVVVADVPSGVVVWARPPLSLLGKARQCIAASGAKDILVIHDERSAQLVALSSGSLLSGVVDFAEMAKRSPTSGEPNPDDRATPEVAETGDIRVIYHGMAYAPTDPWDASGPSWIAVERRTGIARSGGTPPLTYFLQ